MFMLTSSVQNIQILYDFVFTVWAKLKLQKASERWQPDTEVRCYRAFGYF